MFNFTDSSNIGKCYKGFQLISIDNLPDYKTKAVYLRHRRTGLEVYHILAEDRENTFAFAFRTFAKNSKGNAHIMEHSTLCGSEKYPLKEPFTTLASTSLNTFLNAMTYPDKTVYPGASVVPADYFNMMDVYADAVFFPQLDYKTFIQEGHRLERDENGNFSIQGVVYNEMKGEFSTFMQIAGNNQGNAMYPDSFYSYESGGDPLDIPHLTYQQFLDFHEKFYNPDNCLLFLHGNIPTEKQLDFLDERFMSRIEKKYNCTKDIDYADSVHPVVTKDIQELQHLNHLTESKTVTDIAPTTGSTGELVSINWYTGEADMEKTFLSEVICGNDSSPLSFALKDSGLGDDISPLMGVNGPASDTYFSIGLSGVKKGDENKVFDLIHNTINKIYNEGVSQEDIDCAVMGIDFTLREVTRYWGPYSLVLMNKALNGWVYGDDCKKRLSPISDFEKIKERAQKEGPSYIKSLIKKYFLDQDIEVKYIGIPSDEYFKNREEEEKKLIASLSENLTEEDIAKMQKELDELHEYQQHIETSEETSCIPTTKKEDLDKNIEIVNTDMQFVEGKDGAKVPLFINKEATNGIFYMDVLYPFDRLDPKYFQYMPFLSNILTNLGWNGKKWDQCIQESGCVMGDVWGRTCCGSIPNSPDCKAEEEKYKDYNFTGREWIGVSCKALASQAKETLDMYSEIITKMDFNDKARFDSLFPELKAEKKSGIVSSGVEYSLRRAAAANGVPQALNEIMNGITQLKTVANYKKSNSKKILKLFGELYNECRASGGIIHITADEDTLKIVLPLIEEFAKKTEITSLLPKKEIKMEDMLKNIYESDSLIDPFSKQMLCQETQTGYAAVISDASPYLTQEAASEYIFTLWFRMHTLWDKIRTTGGAYGVSTWADNYTEKLMFYSYRDPTPVKSIQVYLDSMKEMLNKSISDDDIDKTIVSCYGDAIVPASPKKRGDYSFEGLLYCNPQSFKQKKIDYIMSVTPEDVKKAVERLNKGTETLCRTVVFLDESKATYGNKIEIPL